MSSWTLAELVELAAGALAADDVRVASGRVAEVPNERLVRWYTTIGLVDRPTIGRGRAARYGRRQLAQLVAIKRLQAQGLPLADIQERLLGATDEELRRVAELPADPASWPEPVPAPDAATPRVSAPSSVDKLGAKPAAAPFWERRPSRPEVQPVFGVRLAEATLLLPVAPTSADLDAIATAAQPLLDLLASRGLLDPKGSHHD
ncbi:MAG: MerR family transcriptional regulator [Propionicimonas sp.]